VQENGKPASAMRKYALVDRALRSRVEAALRAVPGYDERPEQSCVYRLDFAGGAERVAVKQYTSGTLFLQGAGPAGPLFDRLTHAVEGAGVASVALGKAAKPAGPSRAPKGSSTGVDVERPFDPPWIGSDESGKGDYFGPLVACAVWVDERTLGLLDALGVRDSKALSDAQNRRLAQELRLVCEDRCAEVVVPPERYNALYDQFRGEGKNLNALLAWGHARAIETVIERAPASNAIVDQFADARYIRDRLAARAATKPLTVVQLPRAEANLAVAAASVLARDRFLGWLERASRDYAMKLPKGASDEVEAAARRLLQTHGRDALGKAAKLHFKTTQRVLNVQTRHQTSPAAP
jgi:ribonuclease HIII